MGNDGNHFNDAINDGNNTSVSDEIADALHDASDHLPVYMDVWFDDLVYTDQGVVITEIMVNPAAVSDSYGEWFEISNTTDTTIDIYGWTIKDGDGGEHMISNDTMAVTIMPGDYLVLARNGDSTLNGGLSVDYDYDDISLSNSEGEIILLDGSSAIVDEVHYTSSWAFSSGVSMEIHDLDIDNNIYTNWYGSSLTYGDGDHGSPGTPYDGSMGADYFETLPEHFSLSPPYPNPFNPVTTLQIHNNIGGVLFLQVLDASGRRIQTITDRWFHPGIYEVQWNAQHQPSGIYFIKLSNSHRSQVQKAVLIK